MQNILLRSNVYFHLGGLINYKSIGLIVKGSLTYGGANIVGDPSTIKYSCYGYYNNISDSEGLYAPIYTYGLFLRIYNKDQAAVFYYAKNRKKIYVKMDDEDTVIELAFAMQ